MKSFNKHITISPTVLRYIIISKTIQIIVMKFSMYTCLIEIQYIKNTEILTSGVVTVVMCFLESSEKICYAAA